MDFYSVLLLKFSYFRIVIDRKVYKRKNNLFYYEIWNYIRYS